ncbi:hypothetical protein [Bacteriovorax sp. Seq25_V]|uniref:hypothetical protein n=1 Tax=Bacteriovorax sp. Seq25_V TaxID=1201288 RepID=UPI00038A0982|nr:hypothetical protein [Bacteriovorax sp. Seq25_V]EQC47390.1 hypothetical protein M900_0794 [Bacteriovorax sp. Seq25_V]
MKKFILVALVAVTSFARNTYVRESANTVLFPGAIVPITSTCLNNDGDLQTTFKVQLYKIVRTSKEREVRIPTEKKFLVTPVDYVQNVCVQYGNRNQDCVKFEKVAKSYPMVSKVEFYKVTETRNSSSEKLIRTELFEVPNCK